jgi:hypothetical protein
MLHGSPCSHCAERGLVSARSDARQSGEQVARRSLCDVGRRIVKRKRRRWRAHGARRKVRRLRAVPHQPRLGRAVRRGGGTGSARQSEDVGLLQLSLFATIQLDQRSHLFPQRLHVGLELFHLIGGG